jgi:Flp pilus assembly pilin Flp
MKTRSRRHNERGGNLVEYLLLITLIFLMAIPAVNYFGGQVSGSIQTTADTIDHPEGN